MILACPDMFLECDKSGKIDNKQSPAVLSLAFPKNLLSWPENQGILYFVYFSNISNEPDIFHGCTS